MPFGAVPSPAVRPEDVRGGDIPATAPETAVKKGANMSKTNKELAVELLGMYLQGIYSRDRTKPITEDWAKSLLEVFYNAVKSIPDD